MTTLEPLVMGGHSKQEAGNTCPRSVGIALSAAVAILACSTVVFAVLFSRYMNLLDNQPNLVVAMPSAFSGVVVQQYPGSTKTSSPVAWSYDGNQGVNEVVFNYMSSNASLRITTVHNGIVAKYATMSNGGCQVYYADSTMRGKSYNARSVEVSPVPTVTVQGRTCNAYTAMRYDNSRFNFSIDATGELCQIVDDGEVYTFLRNVPAPTFYGANPPQCAAANNIASKMLRSETDLDPEFRTESIWGWITCNGCEALAGAAIDAAVDGGCGLLSGGLAVAICQMAIDTACKVGSCSNFICSKLHEC